jgi:hypothetical protein
LEIKRWGRNRGSVNAYAALIVNIAVIPLFDAVQKKSFWMKRLLGIALRAASIAVSGSRAVTCYFIGFYCSYMKLASKFL